MFLLHEDLLPNHLGVWEPLTYVGYAGLGLLYLKRFYSIILDTEYLLLGLALFLLGISASLDVVWNQHIIALPSRIVFLVEDGAKFTGIVSWLLYSARRESPLVNRALRGHVREPTCSLTKCDRLPPVEASNLNILTQTFIKALLEED